MKLTVSTLSFLFYSTVLFAQSKPTEDSLYAADRYYYSEQYEQAQRLYTKYASLLNTERQTRLAEALQKTSDNYPERLKESFNWYNKAADAGSDQGLYGLMQCYMYGAGVTKDSVKALLLNQKLVDREYTEAIYLMGARYQIGYSVPIDMQKATALFKKAADKGHAESAYILGKKEYDGGSGSGALHWFSKAASYGSSSGILAMALIYDQGQVGVTKNSDEALLWYTKLYQEKNASRAEFSYAFKRIEEISATEPTTDLNTVKPLFLKLLAGAVTNYNGLLGQEQSPAVGDYEKNKMLDLVSDIKYFTCGVNLGFKDARIKEVVILKPETDGMKKIYQDMNITPRTTYTYHGEIINYVSHEKALKVYNDWINLIKTILPNAQNLTNNDSKWPAFAFVQSMTNGKSVRITLSVSGNRNRVGIKMAEE